MKGFSIFAAALAFFCAALAAGAQTNVKIAVVDTDQFADEKNGITEYAAAIKLLAAESTEKFGLAIAAGEGALDCLKKQLRRLNARIADLTTAGADAAFEKKARETCAAEAEALEKEIAALREKRRLDTEKRDAETLGPLRAKIGQAIEEFRKREGFVVIFDNSEDSSVIIENPEELDVTEKFIRFYNEEVSTRKTSGNN